jgi:PIN domain nuclease of toxin-antitoxin system
VAETVLDASALLAVLQAEPGAEPIAAALKGGAFISTVNLSEVVSKLADARVPEGDIRTIIDSLGLHTVDFDSELAYSAGLLRPATRQAGLSLGDRACLALALQLGAEAFTTDRAWTDLRLDVVVHVVR